MAEKTRATSLIARALRRRCPRCGASKVFRGWFELTDSCSGCGMRFEREQGYWVGAVAFNTALGIAAFLGSFGLILIMTWPEVPWAIVSPITIVVSLLAVVFGYPTIKLLWVAYDLTVHPLEQQEIDSARVRVEDRP